MELRYRKPSISKFIFTYDIEVQTYDIEGVFDIEVSINFPISKLDFDIEGVNFDMDVGPAEPLTQHLKSVTTRYIPVYTVNGIYRYTGSYHAMVGKFVITQWLALALASLSIY